MRNLSPGPKFSVLVATVVVVTLAVWPIGYAEAEKIPAERQEEERSTEETEISLKQRRSAPIRDRGAYQPAEYQTWETGDDDIYPDQTDPSDSNSYEDDGYGYDDDEYDHFNYKRYDNGKNKLDEGMKTRNEEIKGGAAEEKGVHVIMPEATTIEMLSFQAKNMNPKAENMQPPKDEAKMKPFPLKKPEFPDKSEEKETLIEEKLKKKNFEGQKSDGNSNEKSTGTVEEKQIETNKPSDMKESTENKVEKGKEGDSATTGSSIMRNLKESTGVTGSKENSVSVRDGKNDARVTDKDLKAAEAKIHQDETSGVKIKAEKDMDAKMDEAKIDAESAKDDSRERYLSQYEANILENDDYKDGFDNMNYPGLADDEKGSEDSGMNLAGLRDSRTELPYQNANALHSGKFLKKKETSRRMHQGSHNSIRESKSLAREGQRTSGTKEPFHLEFPVSDFENADYHRNHLKSFQRFNDFGESAHILSQGDTPNPYADEAKKYIAPKVIEEEQRKRRSRLRRLKSNPAFAAVDEEEDDSYDYGYAPRFSSATRYGLHRRNILGKGYGQPSFVIKNYRRRGFGLARDGSENDFEEEVTNNVKNKRQDNAGSYKEEDETYVEKRKSHLKNAWSGGENAAQKKKMKEANLSEEQNRYNSPLVLLRKNDNGQQAVKTFVDGRYKNEEGLDPEDLARLLSRDSNYVVLKKVPTRDQAQNDNGNSKSSVADTKKKVKITHSDLTIKAHHSPDAKESDVGKLMVTLKEGHGDRPLKGRENRIEDLSDFFKVQDVQEDRDLDEKKEMVLSLDNRPIQYHRGELNKNGVHKPSPSQSFRRMKDLNEAEKVGDSDFNMITMTDESSEADKYNGQSTERLLKSFKKNGKEFLVINKAFGALTLKENNQDAMTQSPDIPGVANVMPSAAANPMANIAVGVQASTALSDNMKMPGASMMPADTNQNWMTPANAYQNVMMPGSNFQEIKLPEMQKGTDANQKYFLYGSDSDMANAPKHEVRVMQGGFQIPTSSPYNAQNYNQQFLDWQNYNKFSSMKNTQGGKTQPLEESKKENQYSLLRQPYDYAKTQQCLALAFQQASPSAETKQGFKRLAKKDKSSGGLERFIRDFQDFSQASYPNTYVSTDLPGMSLQELTGHGNRQLQKLNNILKEIMRNNAEENGNDRTLKNLKRGMFQKYKDEKNWPLTGGGGDAQVRSGKWTSVVYDGSSQLGYSDKNNSLGESSLKERKLEGKNPPAMLDNDTLLSKRTKRQSRYDVKDSTKILEHKVQSTPCNVQLQPLFPRANTAHSSSNNRQHKSSSKSHLQLPPDKLMELINFFRSEREEFDRKKNRNAGLCRRSAPAEYEPPRVEMLSLSEREDSDENGQKKTECVRRSFESYLDPLVRRIGKYETKAEDGRRRKREIDLDESMPNDFQNFLVTSLGSFGSQKRGVVKKDEAVWDSEGSREESALGKRDTSRAKSEKDSVSKEDATNIRIKIVDGNGNGELEAKASEGAELSKEEKTGDAESNGGASVHEVYLITNADSKRRKKKKFANIRSDQSPQKQPISNHLPQVETVYNPSPGNNKAQLEKISGDSQMKGKCPQSQTVCNATASMIEDNIIRNNLRTGNINTFTYQHKEEPTPYPLQDPTNPPSGEFEMLSSKSLSQTKPKTLNNQAYNRGNLYVAPGNGNSGPEIIYKDQAPLQYKSSSNKRLSMTRPDYLFNPVLEAYKGGKAGSSLDRCRKDHDEEESVNSEYDDGEFCSEESSDRQAYQDYEEQESGKQGNRRQDAEYSKAQEYLDPKMVALWKDYARTHLSPERHKEAMEREFQEAYFRSSGRMRYVGGYLNNPNSGVNLMQNMNSNYFDYLEKQKAREKLNKRRLTGSSKFSQPVQIGRRYFYSFKSELPDEAYYSIYKEPSRLKGLNANAGNRLTENREKSSVMKLSSRQLENARAPMKHNSDHLQGFRVKRSEGDSESVEGFNIEKRLSSGRLTENHYQKYHKKNLNLKREDELKEEREGRGTREGEKRDSLAEFLKSDMLRRIEEEKKIRSKVKGLTSDLNDWEVPVIGLRKESSSGEKASLPEILMQRMEEEKKKEKDKAIILNLENQQQQVQHQYGHLKNGIPDVFRTFDIKRGRREECSFRAKKKRTAWPGGKHAIVNRAEPAAPQDGLFFKDVKTRKVKKYSSEGFEPLTPDVRFFDKSSFYSESTKNSDGPYRVPLDEKESAPSGINRRAGGKTPKAKQTNAGGQLQKLQKLTHGFSHEAPLLTSGNSITSAKISDALKGNPSPKEDLSSRKYALENSLLAPADTREKSHLKSSKETASSSSKEPLVSAVLVLAKREDASGRRTETDNPAQSSFQMEEGSELSSGEEEEKPSGIEKRKAEWLKRARGDFSRFRSGGQSPEIVNEEGDSRCSEGDTPAKTVSNKMVHKVKKSFIPSRQMHNDSNENRTGIGNPGEDILESILGKVESNPHFRKVIGPGLKWRGAKCYPEASSYKRLISTPSHRGVFFNQVKKVLARFVKDIEKLASQDLSQNICNKLDTASNTFLHELLDVEVDTAGTSKRRKFLESLLREPSCFEGRVSIADEEPSSNLDVGARESRRDLVARLLDEYRSLPDDEKKSVEVLGQYLNHELETLNQALPTVGVSSANSDEKRKERLEPADSRECGAVNADKAGNASNAAPEMERGPKLSSAGMSHARSNQEDRKSRKDDSPQSNAPINHVPSCESFAPPFTETSNSGSSGGSAGTAVSGREERRSPKERRLPGLDNPGHGDAAGLQQSPKSRGGWPNNNLFPGKGKRARHA